MKINDRSNGSFPGSITRHGCDHVRTSDGVVASDFGSITGEGTTQGMAHIPGNPVPEVAIVNGDAEPCCTAEVDATGSITQGDPAQKCASVVTHPQLMASHRHSSITHEDHKAVHSGVERTKKLEKPAVDAISGNFTPTEKVEKSATATLPTVMNLGRQPYSVNAGRPATRVALTMGEVQDRKRHPEKYLAPVDNARESAVTFRRGQAIQTGDAIANPGEGQPFGSIA